MWCDQFTTNYQGNIRYSSLFRCWWTTPGLLKCEQQKFEPAAYFIWMVLEFHKYIICSMNNGAWVEGERNICWRLLKGVSYCFYADRNTHVKARRCRLAAWFWCTLKAHLISNSFYEPTHPSDFKHASWRFRAQNGADNRGMPQQRCLTLLTH